MPGKDDETIDMAALGEEGEVCSSCGSPLAIDQRYCLNCGTARAEPRLDFHEHVGATSNGTAKAAEAQRPRPRRPPARRRPPTTTGTRSRPSG